MDINVKQATSIIEDIRMMLAERRSPEQIEQLLQHYEIKPIVKCLGEAHSNPHIDSCGSCMPRWGWAGEKVVVKGRMPKKGAR
jgi:hypothetical protein